VRAVALAQPLESLGAPLVGTWEVPGSRQVHEWGVGRKLLRSRGYAGAEGDWTLVSEGVWYWDDPSETLRGVHLAAGMPVDRFEYETTVEGDTVVHRLRAFTEGEDAVQRFVETWAFSDDAYEWRLERVGPDGLEPVMGGRTGG